MGGADLRRKRQNKSISAVNQNFSPGSQTIPVHQSVQNPIIKVRHLKMGPKRRENS